MDKKTFLIIDSHALIHRAFHAFPPTLSNAKGEPTNAVYGFAGLLLDVLSKFTPTRVVAVFDSHGPTVRSTEFTQYKANRAETDELLISQFPKVYDLIQMFDIPMVIQDGIEADDLIGTLDDKYSNDVMRTVIVTGDRDLLQLVDEDTFVYLAGHKFSESKLYDAEMVKEKMGVAPKYITDLKGLSGDTSDNIPGVAGIGAKGAADLINKYGTIEEIYAKIDQIEPRYQKKLIDGQEEAFLSKQLATIYKDIPISFNYEHTDFSVINRKKVINFFQEMQFRSLMSRLDKFFEIYNIAEDPAELDLFGNTNGSKTTQSYPELAWDGKLLNTTQLYILSDLENGNLSPVHWKLNYLLALDLKSNKVYKVEEADIAKFFEVHNQIEFITFDKKILLHSLLNLKFNNIKDVSIKDLGVDSFILAEGRAKFDLKSILGWAGIYSDGTVTANISSLVELDNFLASKEKEISQKSKLIELEDTVLYITVEMEQNGITVDRQELAKFNRILTEKLEEFQTNVYLSAGHEFNLNSPKQVSDVLFKEKALPTGKKTKGGALSTNESTLRSLVGLDPIIENLLGYREVDKLLNTYVNALPEYVDNDGKIRAIFDQFGAVSGRYSSKNPNLQNIPFTEAYGVNIRNAFVSSPKSLFVSFDYSQQELRILAALSKEDVMVDSFNNGVDIHKITASELFDVAVEEVDIKQRQIGKTVNFSVIYGISAFGLSERLGLNRAIADTFIKKYFANYPKVKAFLDNTINSAKETGYSETILGRRRINEMIRSNNRALRQAAERELFNFVIQGSAADIMKTAMSKFPSIIEKYNVKLLLQIHDEYLFEFEAADKSDENLNAFITEIKDAMRTALDLGVEYKVEVNIGNIWGEL